MNGLIREQRPRSLSFSVRSPATRFAGKFRPHTRRAGEWRCLSRATMTVEEPMVARLEKVSRFATPIPKFTLTPPNFVEGLRRLNFGIQFGKFAARARAGELTINNSLPKCRRYPLQIPG